MRFVDLIKKYMNKLQNEKYDQLISETYNIKLRQTLLADMTVRCTIKPVRKDGVSGEESSSNSLSFTKLLLEEEFDNEWPEITELLEFRRQVISTQQMIAKCDPNCSDTSDY